MTKPSTPRRGKTISRPVEVLVIQEKHGPNGKRPISDYQVKDFSLLLPKTNIPYSQLLPPSRLEFELEMMSR